MQPGKTLRSAVLAAAAALALVLIPSAASADGQALIVGTSANSASSSTILTTTGANGLKVSNDHVGDTIALDGLASTTTGRGWGVYGEAQSGSTDSIGVFGRNLSTGTHAVGVKGQADGPVLAVGLAQTGATAQALLP